jgi:hypothetical protein
MVPHILVHSGFVTELFGEKLMCGRAVHKLLLSSKLWGWGLLAKV